MLVGRFTVLPDDKSRNRARISGDIHGSFGRLVAQFKLYSRGHNEGPVAHMSSWQLYGSLLSLCPPAIDPRPFTRAPPRPLFSPAIARSPTAREC